MTEHEHLGWSAHYERPRTSASSLRCVCAMSVCVQIVLYRRAGDMGGDLWISSLFLMVKKSGLKNIVVCICAWLVFRLALTVKKSLMD